MGSYGDNGKQYIQWCAQLAQSYQIGIPWVMCQQSDAPDPMVNDIKFEQCININVIYFLFIIITN